MEISPRSLRIGNYLSEGEVIEIGETYFRIESKSMSTFHSNCIDITPIPLTSEWLLKFGFEERPKNTFKNIALPYYCLNGVCLFFNESPPDNTYLMGYGFNHSSDYYVATARWVDSVHELQNYYYALTGEELTIQD